MKQQDQATLLRELVATHGTTVRVGNQIQVIPRDLYRVSQIRRELRVRFGLK